MRLPPVPLRYEQVFWSDCSHFRQIVHMPFSSWSLLLTFRALARNVTRCLRRKDFNTSSSGIFKMLEKEKTMTAASKSRLVLRLFFSNEVIVEPQNLSTRHLRYLQNRHNIELYRSTHTLRAQQWKEPRRRLKAKLEITCSEVEI